jgi:hypothetical protein
VILQINVRLIGTRIEIYRLLDLLSLIVLYVMYNKLYVCIMHIIQINIIYEQNQDIVLQSLILTAFKSY